MGAGNDYPEVSAVAGADWVRWAFAGMFAALTFFYLVRLVIARRDESSWRGGGVGSVDISRGVMSLGMVAMLVPSVDPLPQLFWQVVFSVAAGHIALRLIRRRVRPAQPLQPDLGGRHELHLLIGGLAMVYMFAAMPAGHGMAGSVEGAESMDMPGMSAASFAMPMLTWAFVAYFLIFVVRLGARLALPADTLAAIPAGADHGGGRRGVVISPHLLGSSEVVMGIGMSYMLMTMP